MPIVGAREVWLREGQPAPAGHSRHSGGPLLAGSFIVRECRVRRAHTERSPAVGSLHPARLWRETSVGRCFVGAPRGPRRAKDPSGRIRRPRLPRRIFRQWNPSDRRMARSDPCDRDDVVELGLNVDRAVRTGSELPWRAVRPAAATSSAASSTNTTEKPPNPDTSKGTLQVSVAAVEPEIGQGAWFA
jgi:hypothetical protein